MVESVEQTHVLVVEDDRSLAQWIADYLTSHDFMVTLATRGDDAITLIREDCPDAVVLDLNLPALSGLEVCQHVRSFYDKPIIMLTARDTETDEVLGLETGADDYMSKPVRPAILLARLKALVRRQVSDAYESAINIGKLRVDFSSRAVFLAEERVQLSTHEFKVLWLLVRNAGQPLDRQTLVSEIRGIEYDGFDRSVDICISRLRKKLGDAADNPTRIVTLRGVGYQLVRDAW